VLDFYLLGKQPDAPRKPAPAPADEPDEEEGD
jgi:hypothetical protein